MKTFKSAACLDRVRGDPLHDTLRGLLLPIVCPHAHREYCPEEDGYLVLIEPGDIDRVLDDLDVPYRLAEMPFEVVSKVDGHWHAFYLANNQFGLSFLIPDAEWLPDDLRRHLEENLDE